MPLNFALDALDSRFDKPKIHRYEKQAGYRSEAEYLLGWHCADRIMGLTKDQIRKLTPEQQEALGEAELQRSRSRQQLLERTRQSRGMNVTCGLLTGLAGGLAILSTAIPRVLPFAIIAVIALVGRYVTGLHRRLDASMELLDEDIKKTTKTEQSDHDNAA